MSYIVVNSVVIQVDPSLPHDLLRPADGSNLELFIAKVDINNSFKHYKIYRYAINYSGLGIYLNSYHSVKNSFVVGDNFDGNTYVRNQYAESGTYKTDVMTAYIYPKNSDDPFYNYISCCNATKNSGDGNYPLLSFDVSAQYGDSVSPVIISDFVSGFIRFDQSKTIKYSAEYVAGIYEQFSITGGTFYYKKSSASSYSSIAFSGTSITIPANTFEHGSTYDVYSVVTVDDGQTSTTEVKTLITTDGMPYCTAVSPVNEIVYGSATLKWSYTNAAGMDQYKYDLQISADGSSWTTIKLQYVSSLTQLYVSSIASGIKYWRVRSYNQDSVASSWSQAYFVNRVKPDAPIITQIMYAGRPTISWSSGEQVAYRLILGDYDSGQIYSTAKTHLVEEYIPNGNYVLKIRIFNSLGIYSDWAVTSYSQNMSVEIPDASVVQIENGFKITVSDNQYSKIYVLKDGVPCMKMAGTTYFDPYVNSTTEYIIRGVTSDDTFADYKIKETYQCRKSVLILLDGTVVDVSNRVDNRPEISKTISRGCVRNTFYGDENPTHTFNKMYSNVWNVTCNFDAIKDHLGEIMFYRNYNGDHAWVVCSSSSSGIHQYGNEVSFSIEQTNYDGRIEYDL